MVRAILVLAFAVASGCAITRETLISKRPLEFTEEEIDTIDHLHRNERADDSYYRCLAWRNFLQAPHSANLTEYAKEARDDRCGDERVKKVEAAIAEIAAANKAPEDLKAQTRAVARVLELFGTNLKLESLEHALDSGTAHGQAQVTIAKGLVPLLERLRARLSHCHDGRVIGVTYGVMRDHQRAWPLLLESRDCIGSVETAYLLRVGRRAEKCEPAIAVAAVTWERVKTKEQQIAILDGINACSDAYTRRRNFSFVPPEVMLDYESLLMHRESEALQSRLAEAKRKMAESCRAACKALYCDRGPECRPGAYECEMGCGGY